MAHVAAAFDAVTDGIMWTSVFYLGFLRSTYPYVRIAALIVLAIEWTLTCKIVRSILVGRVVDWCAGYCHIVIIVMHPMRKPLM
jgi:hypothetical protein